MHYQAEIESYKTKLYTDKFMVTIELHRIVKGKYRKQQKLKIRLWQQQGYTALSRGNRKGMPSSPTFGHGQRDSVRVGQH